MRNKEASIGHYHPGDLWTTRKDISAFSTSDGKYKTIPAKNMVILLKYLFTSIGFEENVAVLYDNKIYYILDIDVAHCFITKQKSEHV